MIGGDGDEQQSPPRKTFTEPEGGSDSVVFGDVAARVDSAAPLAQQAARGTALIVGGRLGGQAFQFLSSIALARLLLPSAYGLVAVVSTILAFASLFGDLGLGSALVQAPRMTEEDASTAFVLNGTMGLVLTMIVVGLRHPLADLFGQPRLVPLLVVASLSFTLSLNTVPYAILERTMRFGIAAAIDLGSTVVGLSISIACAASGVGAMSLVIGPVIATALASIFGLRAARWLPKARPTRVSLSRLMRFGGHLTFFNIVAFWARNTDTILLGRFADATQLGLYNRAYQLMLLPVTQVGGVLGRVLLPLFSSMQDDQERLRAAVRRVSRITAALVFPSLLGLAAIAHNFVLVAYGPHWRGAIPLIILLALSGLPQIFGIVSAQVSAAVGRTQLLSTWGTIWSLSAIAAIAAGLPWRAEGIAIALAVRGLLSIPIEMMPARRAVELRTMSVVRACLMPFIAALVMAVVVVLAGVLLDRYIPMAVALLAQIAIGGVAYIGIISVLDRGALDDALLLVRRRKL